MRFPEHVEASEPQRWLLPQPPAPFLRPASPRTARNPSTKHARHAAPKHGATSRNDVQIQELWVWTEAGG